jgi:hypothetical protein
MKKNNNQVLVRNKHKRALKAAKRRAAFKIIKENWKRGIGLYETYTKEERNKSDKL